MGKYLCQFSEGKAMVGIWRRESANNVLFHGNSWMSWMASYKQCLLCALSSVRFSPPFHTL